MSRSRRLFWVVMAAAGLLVAEAVSALVLWLGLPSGGPGRGRGAGLARGRELWGLDRGTWVDVHRWLGLALLVVLAVHVAMHRRWIAGQVRRRWERPEARADVASAAPHGPAVRR